jgi:phage-related tail protein
MMEPVTLADGWSGLIALIGGLMVLISFVSTIRTWMSSEARKNAKDVAELRETYQGLNARVTAAEDAIKAMPGRDDMHRLEIMMTDMSGDMKAVRATMRGMSDSMTAISTAVSRHEDHLLNKGAS